VQFIISCAKKDVVICPIFKTVTDVTVFKK